MMIAKNFNKIIFIILLFGILVSLLSTSIKTTYQVFFISMAESFGLTRGEFAISGTLFMAVFGFSSPVVGYIADRIGAKQTITLGMLLTGITFILMANSANFVAFAIFYGVIAAFAYTMISYVSLGILVDEISSPAIKGFMYALVTNGAALGFIILSPLWLTLEPVFSWQSIYTGLGIIFLIPLTLLSFWVMRMVTLPKKDEVIDSITFKQCLKLVFYNRNFYLLSLGFLGCGVTMAYVDIHLVSQLKDLELSKKIIGLSLAILGVTEFIGGLLAGYLCDRYRNNVVLFSFYLLRAFSVFVLYSYPTPTGVLIFAALFGLSFMGTVVGTSVTVLSIFGKEVKGFAFGFVWFFHQVGAVLATQIGANLYDVKGDYKLVLLITSIVALISALISLFITTPRDN